jgi:hypothetical protein
MTVSDLDIYRSAKLLTDQHGDAASLHAANRCDEMLDKGDLDGRAVWSQIYEAVMELMKTEPGEGERVQ